MTTMLCGVRNCDKVPVTCPGCKVERTVSGRQWLKIRDKLPLCLTCSHKVRRNPAWKVCRHCKRCPVNRPRGLCYGCFYRPGVKELYPSVSTCASRGYGATPGKVPKRPTKARPGSADRIRVMAERAKRGDAITHPDDATLRGHWRECS